MKKPDDPFDSPKRQLKRGKLYIERLRKRFLTFLDKVSHTQVIEQHPNGRDSVVKIVFNMRIPVGFDETAYMAIDAIRSALDQTGYAAAVAGGKVKPKKAYFPIADSPSELEGNITKRRICADIPDEVVAVFRSFSPYKGGNDTLWALNKLRQAFHTSIIPTMMSAGGFRLTKADIVGGYIYIPEYDADKNEIILARLKPGGTFEYDGAVALTITFDEIDFLKGIPIFGPLGAMADEVAQVLSRTETECRRIGII